MPSLYFTFLDGAFRYDCPSCGQACCRGKGVAVDAARELVPLLKRAPAIAPLLEPLPGGYVRLPDVTDGCWFLRSDGMCAYELEHGAAAKFTTCRLFPFNRVFRVGAVQVVDVNSVVCPVQDAYGSGGGVSHDELTKTLQSFGDGPLTSSAAEPPAGARELRWQTLEQSLLERSAGQLSAPDYTAFAEEQLGEGQRRLGLVQASTASLRELAALYREIYGPPPFAAETARALTLLTPSLRWNALFKKGAPAYREQLVALPRQLLAGWYLAALAGGAKREPLSLRGLTELYQAQAGLRALLARLDQPASLVRPLVAPELSESLIGAAAALSQVLAGKPRLSVGEAILRVLPSLPVAERALLPALLLRAGAELQF